ncbi:MAG: F0F1 ATP synthase subunit B [Flavobacteriales bacterium]|nr:hypothetical protein [Flavobacteriales bacterium]MCB9168349.1 F0F1 ATP synthase subunit B [Flavobacteriales bacterium]
MLFDPFTIIAQIINFLVLVWLLRRFLYRPVLDAIQAREDRIASGLRDAAREKAEAASERDELVRRNAAFDRERDVRMKQVQADVERQRSTWMDAARKEHEAQREQLRTALDRERDEVDRAIDGQLREGVFALAGKTLHDLADATLADRMADKLVERLVGSTNEERARLRDMLMKGPVIVRSAFELDEDHRKSLSHAIKDLAGATIDLHFEVPATRIDGIELVSDGLKVSWTISGYLRDMEEQVRSLLRKGTDPGTDRHD